jgi:hypothetical protein
MTAPLELGGASLSHTKAMINSCFKCAVAFCARQNAFLVSVLTQLVLTRRFMFLRDKVSE